MVGSWRDRIPKDGQVWYFSYGSNMNCAVLEKRRNIKCVFHHLPMKYHLYYYFTLSNQSLLARTTHLLFTVVYPSLALPLRITGQHRLLHDSF